MRKGSKYEGRELELAQQEPQKRAEINEKLKVFPRGKQTEKPKVLTELAKSFRLGEAQPQRYIIFLFFVFDYLVERQSPYSSLNLGIILIEVKMKLKSEYQIKSE